jgi:hypothetical protein
MHCVVYISASLVRDWQRRLPHAAAGVYFHTSMLVAMVLTHDVPAIYYQRGRRHLEAIIQEVAGQVRRFSTNWLIGKTTFHNTSSEAHGFLRL